MSLNPILSVINTMRYVLTGRLHFPRHRIGEVFTMGNSQQFTVFRHVIVDSDCSEMPGAVFIPRFHVAGMSIRANIMFSVVPIPFYVGLPGFRSKLWMVDWETGDFAGYYQWDTVQDAENYSHSFAARFMTGRSVPGTVSFRVYPASEAPAPPGRLVRQ